MKTERVETDRLELDNQVTRVYLWSIESQDAPANDGWGYHGDDDAPCDAEYVLDRPLGGYFVATADAEPPKMTDGWSVKPAELEAGYFARSEAHSVCVMRCHGGNEYTIAMLIY